MPNVSSNRFLREQRAGYRPELLNKTVATVVGVGALGGNIVQALALTGVGEIRLIDGDQFEDHNRTRTPLFPRSDQAIGLPKASAVARELAQVMTAPSPKIRYADAWLEELGGGALDGSSIIFAAVDQPKVRSLLAEMASLQRIPFVEGGFSGPQFNYSVFQNSSDKASGPCWNCVFSAGEKGVSCADAARAIEAQGNVPALQTTAMTLAGYMVEAGIQGLHGSWPSAATVVYGNTRSGETRRVGLVRNQACSSPHGPVQAMPLLTIGPDRPLRDLFDCARQYGPFIGVVLPVVFAFAIRCPNCGEMTMPKALLWAWQREPLCSECGGGWPRSSLALPLTPKLIRRTDEPQILDLTCREVGLSFGSPVEFEDANDRRVFCRLAGGPDELFKEINL